MWTCSRMGRNSSSCCTFRPKATRDACGVLWRTSSVVVDCGMVGILLELNVTVPLEMEAHASFVKILLAACCHYFGRNLGTIDGRARQWLEAGMAELRK